MVSSFAVFLVYLILPFLQLSLEVKVRIGIVAWVVSWTFFFAGMLLAGRDGYLYLRAWIRQQFRRL